MLVKGKKGAKRGRREESHPIDRKEAIAALGVGVAHFKKVGMGLFGYNFKNYIII